MITLPYGLFMAEAERSYKIDKIIKAIKSYPEAEMPNTVFYVICKEYDIIPGTLTEAEMKYIEAAIQS